MISLFQKTYSLFHFRLSKKILNSIHKKTCGNCLKFTIENKGIIYSEIRAENQISTYKHDRVSRVLYRVNDQLIFELVDEEDVVDGDGDFVGHAFEKLGAEPIMKVKGVGTAKRNRPHHGILRHYGDQRF